MSAEKSLYDLDAEYVADTGFVRVTLSHIGEGYQGDYNPDDPVDRPLLRLDLNVSDSLAVEYDIDTEDDFGSGWVYPDGGSMCTYLVADGDEILGAVASLAAHQAEAWYRQLHSTKSIIESLSQLGSTS